MDTDKTVLNVIHSRKSVRHYTEQTVSREILETLVRAGMSAPSAVNRQPWVFIAIDERQTLDELGSRLPYARMLLKTNAAIVVCGDMKKAPDEWQQEFWIQDCSAATENILIAAEAIGLGSVWTAVYPAKDRIEIVRRSLNLPDHIIPLNVLPIGFPDNIDKPKDKWNPGKLIWNKWV
ncbi:MAG: nitroreductase [Bacteroidetes bacterium]|nr:MAG: nitroreductase [Bacteroidota bacterium]